MLPLCIQAKLLRLLLLLRLPQGGPKKASGTKPDLPTPSLLWTCRLQKTDAASISHEWYQQFNNSRTEDDLKQGD